MAASVDSATVDGARAPDPETRADDEAEEALDGLDGGAEGPGRGIDGSPGPSTTTGGGGAVEGVSVGGSDGATRAGGDASTGASSASGSIRSVASSSLTPSWYRSYPKRRSAI
jgi:hypothetical protein